VEFASVVESEEVVVMVSAMVAVVAIDFAAMIAAVFGNSFFEMVWIVWSVCSFRFGQY
jgi:hypothetical protein